MNLKVLVTTLVCVLHHVKSLGLTSQDLHQQRLAEAPCHVIEPGALIYHCTVPGTFAVTFDDGPSKYTKELLYTLKRLNVTVTFFVIGANVDNREYGSILKQMKKDGHQIASHTYTHPHLPFLSDEKIEEEIIKTSDAIERMVGDKVNYIRCPYGECDSRVLKIMKKFGYRVIDWSLDTKDWTGKTPSEIVDVYKKEVDLYDQNAPGKISLQHDLHLNTVTAAHEFIKLVQDRGYKVTTVAECLGEAF